MLEKSFQADPELDPALEEDLPEVKREVWVQLPTLRPLPRFSLESLLPPLHEALEGRNTSKTPQSSSPEGKPDHSPPREELLHEPWPPVLHYLLGRRYQGQGQDPAGVPRRPRLGHGSV